MRSAQRILFFLFCSAISFSTIAQQTDGFKEEFLNLAATQFGLAAGDVADYVISDNTVTASTGVRHIYLQQQYQGIKIYNAILGLHISADGSLVHSTSNFVPKISGRVQHSKMGISAESALHSATQHLNLQAPTSLKTMGTGFFNGAGISEEEIPYSPIYQLADDGQLILCWNLVIKDMHSPDWWDIRVDAQTGEIVDKTNWTVHCNWEHGGFESRPTDNLQERSAYSEKKMDPAHLQNPDSYNVFPLGIESPNHGPRMIETNPADVTASPHGWHDTDGNSGAEFTITRGNNVHAYEDRNSDNQPGFSPDGGASLDFDFPLDLAQSLVASESAVITNLFYWNNLMHDIWYQYGFDEASGNFQSNNYGKGGLGGDYVLAEAQDGSGTENANFATPPDGYLPRMQMYFWPLPAQGDVTVNSPMISLLDDPAFANFGPTSYNVTGDLVLVDDGTANPSFGCSALVNGVDVNGKIAVIDRGGCQFSLKALNAQNAGAIAVIICNNNGDAPFTMGPGDQGDDVTIPAIMISQADCQTIRNALPGVNLTLELNATPGPASDSDVDNGVIAHEYGHGISTRLTGGPGTAGCLGSQEQMGEGWSDWFGLVMTMNAGDVGTDIRGIGTYLLGQSTAGQGIRPYPYSTDMGINPHTYNSIQSVIGSHGIGSVWCEMLWEMTWLLIEEYGYDDDLYGGMGGNNRAMHLVIEGLKLQVCNPGFVDGRDAILAADQLLYAGANQYFIWKAFAKRGLGYSASQGSSNSLSDGVEAYDLPPDLMIPITKTVDKLVAEVNDTLTYSIVLHNVTDDPISNVVITDDIPDNTIYVDGSASDAGSLVDGAVVFPATTLTADQELVYTFKVAIDPAIDAAPYNTLEDAESLSNDWTPKSTNAGLNNWSTTSNTPYSGSGVWFAPDIASPNEQYLTISEPIVPTAFTELKFWHNFDTEATWDGGLIQVSVNNKISWQDLGEFITQNGYNSTIDQNVSAPAFSGSSGGYLESIVDLSSFADQDIYVRFWMHCDAAVGGVGWFVDNIELTNLKVRIPNTVLLSADGIIDNFASLEQTTRVKGNCEDILVFTSPFVNVTEEHRANFQIQLSSVISDNSEIYFRASDNLQFDHGFEVQIGNIFQAAIGPCDDPPPSNRSTIPNASKNVGTQRN